METDTTDIEEFYLGERKFQGKYIVEKEFVEDEEVRSKIYHQYLRTEGGEKLASVVIVHGLNEHGSLYTKFALLLADQGFNVHLYDWRGCGFSSGGRDTNSLSNLYEDFFSVLAKVRKDLPLFVLGHSMGGGTLLSLLLQNPKLAIAGVILSNPFIRIDHTNELNISRVQKFMFKIMPAFMDEFKVSTRCSVHMVAHGEKLIKKMALDPFFPRMIGTKMIKTALQLEKSLAQKHLQEFVYPTLFMLGSKDRMTPPRHAHQFCKSKKFKDLTVKEIPEGYHEMFNDEECAEIAEEVGAWMKQKLASAPDFDFPTQVAMEVPKSRVQTFLKVLAIVLLIWIVKKKRPEFFSGLAWTLGFEVRWEKKFLIKSNFI